MSQYEVSYAELKKEIEDELVKLRLGFLATSENDYVRNGAVFMVSNGLTIYVFTFLASRKFQQMKANPNVGFSVSTLQIEGLATLKGHIGRTSQMPMRQEQKPTSQIISLMCELWKLNPREYADSSRLKSIKLPNPVSKYSM